MKLVLTTLKQLLILSNYEGVLYIMLLSATHLLYINENYLVLIPTSTKYQNWEHMELHGHAIVSIYFYSNGSIKGKLMTVFNFKICYLNVGICEHEVYVSINYKMGHEIKIVNWYIHLVLIKILNQYIY